MACARLPVRQARWYIANMNSKSMATIVFGALAIASLTACSKSNPSGAAGSASVAAEAEPFGRMSVDELAAKQDEAKSGKGSIFVFDNNPEDRFHKGHIPGAKWVKFDKIQASDLPADKEATLVFYCANEH
jgi:hypothetical protein